jgi:hypothetical protein
MDNESLSQLLRMESSSVRPIFVVGSPRSGTSVLAWCLGQHPNIFPVPESNWMGDFAVDVAKSYRVGAGRGNLSILSAMDITAAGLFAKFGESINELILDHRSVLEHKRKLDPSCLRKHAAVGPKARWVDGTPEYSFHICGLRKLFPSAVFIHLVRDVESVVRSLLNFHRISGTRLVANEQEAYDYWLRTVKACLKAEQAYGPTVVHRSLYSKLINKPEGAIQSALRFVAEAYSPTCLEPLGERINSSNVPADFKSDDPATDPAIVEEARRLWAEIEQSDQPEQASTAAAEELEVGFQALRLRRETIEQELDDRIAKQEQHYAGAVTRQQQKYKSQLRKQARDIQELVAMLDEIAACSAGLRSSRFWKFVNRAAAVEAKLFRSKALSPNRRLQKIIRNYSRWRNSHPDIEKVDKNFNPAEPSALMKDCDPPLSTTDTAKLSKGSAKA